MDKNEKTEGMLIKYSVDVIIPTYKPDKKLLYLLKMIKEQNYPVRKIILVNTEKKYLNRMNIKEMPALEVHHISKEEFDHAGTRAYAAHFSEADIMVYMTQDAIPENKDLIGNLIKSFADFSVGAAYARQLPNKECREIERYTRAFNYPDQGKRKTQKDLKKMGIKTFFCSNVCAAYRKSLYTKLGGFIEKAIFNEDMIYAAAVIKSGNAVVYEADARVIHSHNYGNWEQFQRNFDLAVSQKQHPEIFKGIQSEGEGIRLVWSTAKHLIHIGKPWLLVPLVIKSGFKYMGYMAGIHYKKLPHNIVEKCSMNPDYWKKSIYSR